jgi:dimethylargininase
MPQTPLATASIDGGDVMYTGAELIVGLSARTNREGAEALARALAPLAVTTVPVAAGLHLKSVMSVCGPRHIAFAAESEAARAAVAAIRERGVGRYEFVSVPDEAAANCLFINGAVVHRAEAEYPRSAAALRAFCAAERLASRELDVSEFAKADGALTCLSVLLA